MEIINRKSMIVVCFAVVVCIAVASFSVPMKPVVANRPSSHLVEVQTQVPVYFVPDEDEASFSAMGAALDIVLHQQGVTLVVDQSPLQIQFRGSISGVQLVGEGYTEVVSNYFIGNDPARWRKQVPMYSRVLYRELYPGIDLLYEIKQGRLKSEFILQPDARLDQIQVTYPDVQSLSLVSGTELNIELDSGKSFYETLPYAYQVGAGKHIPVNVVFRLIDDKTYGFAVRGAYDPALPLVVDPILFYSTYLGGSANDEGWTVAVDDAGNTYVTGITWSADFPPAPHGHIAFGGDKDVFVARFDASGTLVYVTVLGGRSGEEGNGIAVDSAGNAYVAGETFSMDFPVFNAWQPYFAGYEDAYVLKLNSTGDLVYSTFIGGSMGEEVDDIALDASGNVYIVGEVYSDDYPLLNPWQTAVYGPGEEDGFVSIFNSDGQLVYSTYIGAEERDQVFRVALDKDGYVYGAGMTSSPDFPVVSAVQGRYGGGWDDCFIFKFDPWHNQMIYSTFLGGKDRDECWGLAVDEEGYAYVTGYTLSKNFPLANPIQPVQGGNADAILAKLAPTGNALVYSTFLGGKEFDHGWDLALDSGGNVYVTGETNSVSFPQVNALQSTFGGGDRDAFLLWIDKQGVLQYSSFLGGGAFDRGWSVAVDKDWIVHVAGETESGDFPLLAPAQDHLAGQRDIFVARFGLAPTPSPTPTPFAQSMIGYSGGTFSLAYPGHLTTLTVPPGAVNGDTMFVLVYSGNPNRQGDLQGMDHFFQVQADEGGIEQSSFNMPLTLTLNFSSTGAVIKDTLGLYRLVTPTWITSGITLTEFSEHHLIAQIDYTGIYGVLGQTKRVYLPLVLHR